MVMSTYTVYSLQAGKRLTRLIILLAVEPIPIFLVNVHILRMFEERKR